MGLEGVASCAHQLSLSAKNVLPSGLRMREGLGSKFRIGPGIEFKWRSVEVKTNNRTGIEIVYGIWIGRMMTNTLLD
ncbi:hypothetical protein EVAR_27906_1 [Eumeta japonica]|uniref:Uncharacterized protein n=1 Tax=Eumeta variegata TaxID=151549 RepID=A0A4C1UUW6_EUMVA|nr:hypothetical protein EVAR_27906_1 [Eumeta japonica]